MDYATLPPEVNSARMYAGPGSGPLLAAATGWDGLVAELRAAASGYHSVISTLTAGWLGLSSTRMATAAAPYVTWLLSTAAGAEETANRARAAAAAYGTARATVVPPPVIAENRAELALLTSTNIIGQNTAAIAANEAEYAGMWAQDAAAMYRYAGQAAAASTLTPFSPPTNTTNQAGAANQAAAVAQAVGTSAGTNTQSALAQLTSATPAALHSLAAPSTAAANPLTSLLNSINSSPLTTIAADVELPSRTLIPAVDVLVNIILGLTIGARRLTDIVVGAGSAAGMSLVADAGHAISLVGAAPAVSASVGQAGFVGAMAVPPSWAAATPAIKTAAAVLSGNLDGTVSAATVSQGSLLTAAVTAGVAGGALGAASPRAMAGAGRSSTERQRRLKDGESPQNLQRLVAEMAEKPESVQHWHTDPEHVDALLAELRYKPGIHAVHVKGGKSVLPRV